MLDGDGEGRGVDAVEPRLRLGRERRGRVGGRRWGQGSDKGTRFVFWPKQREAEFKYGQVWAKAMASTCSMHEQVAQPRIAEEYVKKARVGDGDGPRVLIDRH